MRPKTLRETRSRRAKTSTRAKAKKVTRAGTLTRGTKSGRPARVLRTSQAPPAHETGHTEAGVRSSSQFGALALTLCGIGVVAGVILIGRPSSDRVEIATVDPPNENVVVRAQPIRVPPQMVVSAPPANVAELARPAPPTVLPVTGPMPALKTTSIAKMIEMARSDQPAATPFPAANRASHADEPLGTPQSNTDAALVTITGCLETDEETFRLSNTTGSEAPKSRSWKTGFLKKRSAAIAIVDASGVGLPAHVGQRVALTGLLVEHDMQVRSLRRVAASCEQ